MPIRGEQVGAGAARRRKPVAGVKRMFFSKAAFEKISIFMALTEYESAIVRAITKNSCGCYSYSWT